MEFLACQNDPLWWVVVIQEIDKEQEDILVKCMHPQGPSLNFKWRQETISRGCLLTYSYARWTTPDTTTGRMYKSSESDYTRIISLDLEK